MLKKSFRAGKETKTALAHDGENIFTLQNGRKGLIVMDRPEYVLDCHNQTDSQLIIPYVRGCLFLLSSQKRRPSHPPCQNFPIFPIKPILNSSRITLRKPQPSALERNTETDRDQEHIFVALRGSFPRETRIPLLALWHLKPLSHRSRSGLFFNTTKHSFCLHCVL